MNMGWLSPGFRGLVGALACVAVLSGCGGRPPAEPGGTPPGAVVRTSTVNANPCALLTSAQRHQLGVGAGSQARGNDQWPGEQCVWTGFPSANGDPYIGRIIDGAAPAGSPAPAINAFPTASYTSPGADPNLDCVYLVAVTSNRTLWAEYRNDGGLPGLNRVVACRKAQAAAAGMASTYRSLPQ